MKQFLSLILTLCAVHVGHSREQPYSDAFTEINVKKRTSGKTCDTCQVDFTFNGEREFSYIITGTGATPLRFSPLLSKIDGPLINAALQSSVHIISQRNIGISFVPNFLQENSKRIQLYRNFGGDPYDKLEFKAEQNGRLIKQWTHVSALGENKAYVILGGKALSNNLVFQPWKRTFYTGMFELDVNDTLHLTIRNIITKKVIQVISIIRAEDRASNFVYYQVPLSSENFTHNLQNILNVSSNIRTVYTGDSLKVFEKDFGSIGLLRFLGLREYEEIEYSFESSAENWASASSKNSKNGVFIVLGNDMEAGKDHDLYLRYKSQPETIHKIIIKVNKKPFEIPWGNIAAICILVLTAGSIGLYLWMKKNKRNLAALKRKNEDIKTRLSLLSGQLNPHFLFNSLNAIQGTINNGNPERANTYIGNVAAFMRDVMDEGKKEFVSLQEELKIEEDYLRLEQERMGFSYVITVAPELEPSLVDFPPLLLQPVLENSIRHAFSKDLPDPVITIDISKDNSTLYVEVSDNGNSMWNTVSMREGHGLSLTKKRIAVYNEKLESMPIGMQINYQHERGSVTTFTFQNWIT